MLRIFKAALDKLGIHLDAMPEHVPVLLDYCGGVPRHLPLLFSALAGSDDPMAFEVDDLRAGLSLVQNPHR